MKIELKKRLPPALKEVGFYSGQVLEVKESSFSSSGNLHLLTPILKGSQWILEDVIIPESCYKTLWE